MLNKWAPDMSEHIRRPPFNLRLNLCLFARAFLPVAVTIRGNQVASSWDASIWVASSQVATSRTT